MVNISTEALIFYKNYTPTDIDSGVYNIIFSILTKGREIKGRGMKLNQEGCDWRDKYIFN